MIDFDESTHTYTRDGARLPSVTQVLAPLNDFAGIPRQTLEAARIRGQYVHAAGELIVQGRLDWQSVPEHYRGYVDALYAYLEQSPWSPVGTEQIVYHSRFKYAGRLDLVACNGSSSGVFDWKSGASFPKIVGPQTAAYLAARNSMLDGSGKPLKRLRRRFAVMLHDDGRFDSRELSHRDMNRDFAIFVSCLNVYRWKNPNL